MTDAYIHDSGPNIFEDLGLPDAATHMLKAQMVAELYRLGPLNGVANDEIARRLEIAESEVEKLFQGDFRHHAVERLLGFVTAFGRDIEIVARPRDIEAPGTITFRAA